MRRPPDEELRDFLIRLGGAEPLDESSLDGSPRAREALRVQNSERDTLRNATALGAGGFPLLVLLAYALGPDGPLIYALGAVFGTALAYFIPPRPFKSFAGGSPARIRPTPQRLLTPDELYVSIFLQRDRKNAWIWGTFCVLAALLAALLSGDGLLGSGLLQTAARIAAFAGGAACTLGFAHAASLWRARLIMHERT
ncbi:hypothetical protein E0L93_11240 [Rubrobacter taiwanensis]|uniref:Uncharacterized protein n=1 Tax=Rubrobacter taiwanensis TaxID=185139 RepID=A0A4R1BFU6_9ACTN|nr:hypothetical protein [Rubrobacter taiwanensis]TCJ16050.1 hypothetical protein E0L93_11240 [Rubrobacter taiwanensis]